MWSSRQFDSRQRRPARADYRVRPQLQPVEDEVRNPPPVHRPVVSPHHAGAFGCGRGTGSSSRPPRSAPKPAPRRRAARPSTKVLPPLECPAAARLLRRRLAAPGVGQDGDGLAGQDRRQQLIALLRLGLGRDGLDGADHRQEGLQEQPASHLLEDQRVLHRPAAVAALFFGQARAQPAELGEGGPGLAREAFLGAQQLAPPLEAVFALAEAADAVLQGGLFGGGLEIHRAQSPRTILAMMLRWISLAPP